MICYLALPADVLGNHGQRKFTATPRSFRDRVTVAACLAAAGIAIVAGVESDGVPDLPDLMDEAFDTLTGAR